VAPQGTDLGEMLDTGEIGALISADIPKCVLEKSPIRPPLPRRPPR
jgi:hypothetical protein